MRLIILSIVILSALCSCRSSRQSVTEYTDTTAMVIEEVINSHSTDDILSMITSSRDVELSGITVEFFPPDSTIPDSPAAPKSIKIETATSKSSHEQIIHELTTTDEQGSTNLSAQSATSFNENTRSDSDLLRPADWVVFFSILSGIILISIIFILKSYRK